MLDLVVHKVASDSELLNLLIEKVNTMAVDLTNLQAAASRVATAVDALANHVGNSDSATQAAVDTLTVNLNLDAQKAENAVNDSAMRSFEELWGTKKDPYSPQEEVDPPDSGSDDNRVWPDSIRNDYSKDTDV